MTDSVPPHRLTASAASALIASRALRVEELARDCLARVAERDPAVRAWAFVDPDEVLRQARELDKVPRRGPLHGIPIGVKDVIDAADMPTTHNSPLYQGYRPGGDAACVATLRAAGALILGKTDTTEFAAAGRWAATANPHDLSRSSGGSSAGSAAAVADEQVPLALGTQTGGSLIRPASFCGVFALKPSWGVVSREGAKLYSMTLDTIGWYGRSVGDLRLLAEVFAIGDPVPAMPLRGARIGVCRSPVWDTAETASRDALADATDRLAAAGATMVPLDLPAAFDTMPTRVHRTILHSEGRAAFLNLARQHGAALHDDFHHRVENRDGITREALRRAYDDAARCRAEFDAIAGEFAAVLTPSAIGEAPQGRNPGNPAFNQMWTLLHVPCVNVPGRRGPSGLPVGVTLTGPRFSDLALLAVAESVAECFGFGGMDRP